MLMSATMSYLDQPEGGKTLVFFAERERELTTVARILQSCVRKFWQPRRGRIYGVAAILSMELAIL